MRVLLEELLGPIGFIVTAGLFFPERFRKNYLVVGLACMLAAGSAWLTIEEFAKRAVLKQYEGSYNPPSLPPVLAADEVFWLSIKDTTVIALFEEFIRKFPTSTYAGEARSRLQSLKNNEVVAGPVRPRRPEPNGKYCINVNGRQICE